MKWVWEPIDESRSGTSGDLAKLFKNEGVKEPGVLRVDAPPADATLLAREVIQNSWDAARELHAELEGQAPEFRIVFAFEDLEGEAKQALVEALGLGELAERASRYERSKLGLAEHDVLEKLTTDEPLRILKISEQATTGMHGPFKGAQSKLYLALVSIGVTKKVAGAGGSYGYGKAGLIRGSATRSVVAYTCFREREDDPGVTRRLLGMTYWGLHDEPDGTACTGFARYGQEIAPGQVVPFVNEDADSRAASLGMELRDPDRIEDLGTTFLLVQPTVEPEAVCAAIERNWWPAIQEHQFTAEVIAPDGSSLFPRPRKNPNLKAFIDAWDLATIPQDNQDKHASVTKLSAFGLPGRTVRLGTVALVADPKSWTYPSGVDFQNEDEVDDQIDHRSLVALVRGPRMVVEYLDVGRVPPFVRGVFVAHDDIDDLLRQTEPKAHDSWEYRPSDDGGDGIDPDAPRVAKAVRDRIRSAVSKFRRSLRPTTPERHDIRLPLLEQLFQQLITGRGRGVKPPPTPPRPVEIRILEQKLLPVENSVNEIRMHARVGFALSDNYTASDQAPAEIKLVYSFIEDQRSGEHCELVIDPPAGFTASDKPGCYRGTLGRDLAVFEIESVPYSADWSGRLAAQGNVLRVVPENAEEVAP